MESGKGSVSHVKKSQQKCYAPISVTRAIISLSIVSPFRCLRAQLHHHLPLSRHSPYQTKGRRNSVKPPLDHIWLFDPIDGPSVSVFPLFPALPILWDNVCVFFGVYSYSHTVGPVVHAADAILQSVAPAFSSGSQTPLSRHFPMPTLSFSNRMLVPVTPQAI